MMRGDVKHTSVDGNVDNGFASTPLVGDTWYKPLFTFPANRNT